MKTAYQILETFHEQTEWKILEKQINLRGAKQRLKLMSPGKKYDEVKATIKSYKLPIKNLKIMLKEIKKMMEEKKEKKK